MKFTLFPNLPSDIVPQISQHLDLATLSNLSKTNSDIYSLVRHGLRKSAKANAFADESEYLARTYTDNEGNTRVLGPLRDRDLPQPRERMAEVIAVGNYDAAKFLLDAGVDPNAHTVSGFSMLSLAAGGEPEDENTYKIVDLLLEYGANPSQRNLHNLASTPLTSAACTPNNAMVLKLLDAGADINGVGSMHTIARNCNLPTIKEAVNRGADLTLRLSRAQDTVLLWGMDNDDPDVFPYLLSISTPAMISAQDAFGETLLWSALAEDDEVSIRQLVDAGIDLNVRDIMDDTAHSDTAPPSSSSNEASTSESPVTRD